MTNWNTLRKSYANHIKKSSLKNTGNTTEMNNVQYKICKSENQKIKIILNEDDKLILQSYKKNFLSNPKNEIGIISTLMKVKDDKLKLIYKKKQILRMLNKNGLEFLENHAIEKNKISSISQEIKDINSLFLNNIEKQMNDLSAKCFDLLQFIKSKQ